MFTLISRANPPSATVPLWSPPPYPDPNNPDYVGNYYYGDNTDDDPFNGGGYGSTSGTTLQQEQQKQQQLSQTKSLSQIIGIFMGERVMYGTNFVASFEENVYLQRLQQLDEYVVYNTW